MLSRRPNNMQRKRQRGAAAVEFGIIAILFFSVFFGIIEFGRVFYLFVTVQEVTRCAAREAVVKWVDDWGAIPQQCLFGNESLIAGWEIQTGNVRMRALNLAGGDAAPASKADNMANCIRDPGDANCIRFVEASIVQSCTRQGGCQPVRYQPMFGLIPLQVDIPYSTVRMRAESLGN